MTFLVPAGLFALLTLPLIVLLHMLRERRQRVVVPSLLLWMNLPQSQPSERRRRIPLTLLLLLHLLVAGLFGLAMSRPQLPGQLPSQARHLAIVLDTSTSMAARAGSATRFDQARQRAGDLIRAAQPGDLITLITAGPTATIVGSGGAGDADMLITTLGRIQAGGTGTDIDAALTLAEAALDPQLNRRIVVLTDGAIPTLAPRNLVAPVEWQPFGNESANRAIVDFASQSWGAKLHVYARAANYGTSPFMGDLRLFSGNQLLRSEQVTIPANGETEVSWTLAAGPTSLRAELDGRDPLPRDDQAFLSVARPRPINALLVSSNPINLRRALAAVPGVVVTVVEPERYTLQNTVDLTVFDSYLPPNWPDGAILAINPPTGSRLLGVGANAIDVRQGRLTAQSQLLEGLSLSGVTFGKARVIERPAWAYVQLAIEPETGTTESLILRGRNGAHEIAIWSFDLASSNLTNRLAFPLLMARTVRDLTAAPLPSALQAGTPLALRPDPRTSEIVIVAPDGSRMIIPHTAALELESLTQAGFYQIEERRGNTAIYSGQLGVNAGATRESDLRPRPEPQLSGAEQIVQRPLQRQMTEVWPWLVFAALAILALEWGYILR